MPGQDSEVFPLRLVSEWGASQRSDSASVSVLLGGERVRVGVCLRVCVAFPNVCCSMAAVF